MSTNQESREITENRLEEIWTIFQDCLIRTAKATLFIKKIKSNSQDQNNTTKIILEHKRY